jgi:hypothetical protein
LITGDYICGGGEGIPPGDSCQIGEAVLTIEDAQYSGSNRQVTFSAENNTFFDRVYTTKNESWIVNWIYPGNSSSEMHMDIFDAESSNHTVYTAYWDNEGKARVRIGNSSGISGSQLCYQETANASSINDGNCSLNYTGSYGWDGAWVNDKYTNIFNAFDGNWNNDAQVILSVGAPNLSANHGEYYVNYSKPSNAESSSKLKIRLGYYQGEDNKNLTIPLNCFNQNNLQFKFESIDYYASGQTNVSCYNGSSFQIIYSGRWSQNSNQIREEAMIWDVSGSSPSPYSVTDINISGNREHKFYYNNFHFMSVIEVNGTISIRPHPGTDVNGWGSSLYLQPFFPGAVLNNSIVNSVTYDNNYIYLNISGNVSKGLNEKYGNWNSSLKFSYNQANKKITGNGTYSITLPGPLGPIGDLNLYKLASNYLWGVPLLNGSMGDTGDMEYADVLGGKNFTWQPKIDPATFPGPDADFLSVDVKGDYNQVNTSAQGYEPIAPAYKPSMKVVLQSKIPNTGMRFGGIYDLTNKTFYWADNIGITPVVMNYSTHQNFDFDIGFESEALAEENPLPSPTPKIIPITKISQPIPTTNPPIKTTKTPTAKKTTKTIPTTEIPTTLPPQKIISITNPEIIILNEQRKNSVQGNVIGLN